MLDLPSESLETSWHWKHEVLLIFFLIYISSEVTYLKMHCWGPGGDGTCCSWGLCAVSPSQSQQSIPREERQCWLMRVGDFTWTVPGYPKCSKGHWGTSGAWAPAEQPMCPGDERLRPRKGFSRVEMEGKRLPWAGSFCPRGAALPQGGQGAFGGPNTTMTIPQEAKGMAACPYPPAFHKPALRPCSLEGSLMPCLPPQGATGSLCSWARACLGAGGRGRTGVGWRSPATCWCKSNLYGKEGNWDPRVSLRISKLICVWNCCWKIKPQYLSCNAAVFPLKNVLAKQLFGVELLQ